MISRWARRSRRPAVRSASRRAWVAAPICSQIFTASLTTSARTSWSCSSNVRRVSTTCPPDCLDGRVCPAAARSRHLPGARLLFTLGSPTGHPYHTGRSVGVPTMAIQGSAWRASRSSRDAGWTTPVAPRKVDVSSAEQGEAMAMPTLSMRPQIAARRRRPARSLRRATRPVDDDGDARPEPSSAEVVFEVRDVSVQLRRRRRRRRASRSTCTATASPRSSGRRAAARARSCAASTG